MSDKKKGGDDLNVANNADSTSTTSTVKGDVKSGALRGMVSFGVKKLLEAIFD